MVRDVLLARRQLYFCRLGFGGKGVLRFLEGAKIKITPPCWVAVAACIEFCSGCAIRHGVWLPPSSARCRPPLSHAGVRGLPGESRRAGGTAPHPPTAEETAAPWQGGCPGAAPCPCRQNPLSLPGLWDRAVPRELALCPQGCGGVSAGAKPSSGGAWPGPPCSCRGLSTLAGQANHRANMGGKHVVLGFGC